MKKITVFLLCLPIISTNYVFGQSSTNSPSGLSDSILWPLIVAIIGGIVGSFVSGTWMGYYLSEKKEREKQKNELKKIRSLLNSDYSMINRIVSEYELQHRDMNDKIQNMNAGLIHTSSRDALTDFFANTEFKLMFTFWNTLVNNEDLIKLEPNEIKIFQVTHDLIIQGHVRESEAWHKMANKLTPIILHPLATTAFKIDNFTTETKTYFEGLLKTYENIKWLLNFATQIEWFNLNAEFKLEDVNCNSPVLENKPVTVKDGITIQSDGKHVDSHGTWWY